MYTYAIRQKLESRSEPYNSKVVARSAAEFLPNLVKAFEGYCDEMKIYLPSGVCDSQLDSSRLTEEWLESLPVGETIVHSANGPIYNKASLSGRETYFMVIVGYESGPKCGWIIQSGNADDYNLSDRMGHGTITTNPHVMVKKVNSVLADIKRENQTSTYDPYEVLINDPFTLADLTEIKEPTFIAYSSEKKVCGYGYWIEVYVVD
jgi:hypothetical protein